MKTVSHRFNTKAIGEIVAERNGRLEIEWSDWPSQENQFGVLEPIVSHDVRLWHAKKFITAAPAAPVAAPSKPAKKRKAEKAPAMTPKLIDTSAKVLAVMAAIPNGRMCVLYNESTRVVTFLGCKQIADNPSLYDNAVAAGSVAIAFFKVVRCAPRTPGTVGLEAVTSTTPWCPLTEAQLEEAFQAWVSGIGDPSGEEN